MTESEPTPNEALSEEQVPAPSDALRFPVVDEAGRRSIQTIQLPFTGPGVYKIGSAKDQTGNETPNSET